MAGGLNPGLPKTHRKSIINPNQTKNQIKTSNMKTPHFLTLALGALLIAGCSSTPTHVDTGPIHAATYSFIAKRPGAAPTFAADNWQPIHAMIQNSIRRNLASKGLTEVASGGDVIVAYLIIVGNNASTAAINDYFGYGRDVSALEDKAQDAYSSSKNPNYFEAGTLLVDIIDGRTYKLLKRSYVVRPLLRNPSADVRAARIQEAVDAVLKDVRIAR
jgi:Domain of unknown function (DUF4136)